MTSSEQGALRKQAAPIAKALNFVGARVGRAFSMETQPGRFRIQKTVFLLRHMGYAPARRYSFNLYHMGPYSPDLAQAYYELRDDGLRKAGDAKDIPARQLETLEAALAKSDELLEGLTTTLDAWTRTKAPATALAQAKAIKPHLPESTWTEVRQFLTAHRDLISPT
jgi:uncharacterized protein YwgA